jgi:hypothetical protein
LGLMASTAMSDEPAGSTGRHRSPIFDPDMLGWLLKRRRHNSSWDKRFFILKAHVLVSFHSDPTAKGADAKKIEQNVVWYDPLTVTVGDPGDGSLSIILPQRRSGDDLLLTYEQGTHPEELQRWALCLSAPPRPLQRALDAHRDAHSQLMTARRELRNQHLEKQQLAEQLEELCSVKDLHAQMVGALEGKQRQLEGFATQLRHAQADVARLQEQLRAHGRDAEELRERAARERETAEGRVQRVAASEQRCRRLIGDMCGRFGSSCVAPDDEGMQKLLRIAVTFQEQGETIAQILAAFDDLQDGTVDLERWDAALTRLGLDWRHRQLQQVVLARAVITSRAKVRVRYRSVVEAVASEREPLEAYLAGRQPKPAEPAAAREAGAAVMTQARRPRCSALDPDPARPMPTDA